MEQVFLALAETVIPWIEDRYGSVAAWVVAALLIALPIITVIIIAVVWLTRGVCPLSTMIRWAATPCAPRTSRRRVAGLVRAEWPWAGLRPA